MPSCDTVVRNSKPQEAVPPCPFCGMELINVSLSDPGVNNGWAEHPDNPECMLHAFEFDAFNLERWSAGALEPEGSYSDSAC